MFGGKKVKKGDILVSLERVEERSFNFSLLKEFPLYLIKSVDLVESVEEGALYKLGLEELGGEEKRSITVSYSENDKLRGYKGLLAEYNTLLSHINTELLKQEKSWKAKEREWIKKHEIQEIEKKTLNNIILGQTKIVADTSKSITKFLIEKGFENSDKVFKKFISDTQDFFGSFWNR